MRIGIDIRVLGRNRRGFEAHVKGLLEHLHEVAPDDEFLLYLDHPTSDSILDRPNYDVRLLRSGFRPLIWTNYHLPEAVRRDGVDLFHFPSSNIWFRPGSRAVVTLHDISFMFSNEVAFMPFMTRAYVGQLLGRMRKSAELIVTDSEASRDDICRFLKIRSSRVRVVHLGVSERFRKLPDEQVQEMLQRMGVGNRPYLLSVGSLDARKNLKILISAYDLLRDETDFNPMLVLVGEAQRTVGSVGVNPQRAIARSRHKEDILLLGYVADEDVVALYNGALLLVVPSLYEAFGLPLVEAMACGTPVVASNNAAAPEVAGEAALYFDPHKPEQIAHCMEKVLADSPLSDRMRSVGLERARRFSWSECARGTVGVYRECLR